MPHKLPIIFLTLTLLACSSSPDPAPEPDEQPTPSTSSAADIFATTGQDDRPDRPPSELPSEPDLITDVDDDLMLRFVDSLRALHEYEQKLEASEDTYYHRVADADSPGEVQRIQQRYVAEKEDVVHERGMNFDDFLVLGQRILRDEQLLERLLEEVDAAKVEEFFGL